MSEDDVMMNKLKKMILICFLFTIMLTLLPALSLAMLDREQAPVHSLVSQSCLVMEAAKNKAAGAWN